MNIDEARDIANEMGVGYSIDPVMWKEVESTYLKSTLDKREFLFAYWNMTGSYETLAACFKDIEQFVKDLDTLISNHFNLSLFDEITLSMLETSKTIRRTERNIRSEYKKFMKPMAKRARTLSID